MGKGSKGNVLVICAHSDDQVLGAGGLTVKLSKDGYSVYTLIFSYGEISHPHMSFEHIAKIRVKEAQNADKILSGKGVFFLGLKDSKIGQDFKDKKMALKLERFLLDYKPSKIFTHSIDDIMLDHRAVREAVLKTYDKLHSQKKMNSDIYSFDVWNIWNIKKRKDPELVVDITPHFKTKIKALHVFKSQINVFSHSYGVNILYIGVYIKAFINGLRHGYKLVEVFYKIR